MLTSKAVARKKAVALKAKLAKAAQAQEQERLEALQRAQDAHELVEAFEEIADAPIVLSDEPAPMLNTSFAQAPTRPWWKRMWD